MRLALLAATPLALVLAGAPSAGAAVVRLHDPNPKCARDCSPPILTVVAAPGERNDVALEPGGNIRDAGATLHPETPACVRVDDHTLRCATSATVHAELGDGDDRARRIYRVDAGPGDDEVREAYEAVGGDGDDVLEAAYSAAGGDGADHVTAGYQSSGGPGDDVVLGTAADGRLAPGPGTDYVDGGAGDDTIRDDDPTGRDRLFGGSGRDVLSFEGRAAPVTVDLASQASSDPDVLGGIEGAHGGDGDDVLRGDGTGNPLLGDTGNDVLVGGDGADTLDGGTGFDRFDAGAGDDLLVAGASRTEPPSPADPFAESDAGVEPVRCGDGLDLVDTVDDDLLARDCEHVGPRLRVHPVKLGPRRVTFFVRCPDFARGGGRCRGTLRLDERYPGNRTGYGDPARTVRFAVGARGGRVALPRTSASVVQVTLRLVEKVGPAGFATRWRIVLSGPGSGSTGG